MLRLPPDEARTFVKLFLSFRLWKFLSVCRLDTVKCRPLQLGLELASTPLHNMSSSRVPANREETLTDCQAVLYCVVLLKYHLRFRRAIRRSGRLTEWTSSRLALTNINVRNRLHWSAITDSRSSTSFSALSRAWR